MPSLKRMTVPKARLLAAARKAMHHAYAPYSEFHVGAAIQLDNGKVVTGCNVENASYGLTICAERNAVCAAVAQASGRGKLRIRAVAVANNKGIACSPCGACRQFIAEFSDASTVVMYQGKKGIIEKKISDLLPDTFRFGGRSQ